MQKQSTRSEGQASSPALTQIDFQKSSTNPLLVSRFLRASRTGGLIVGALGLLVLVGWVLDVRILKSVHPSLATMKANSAFLFAILGAGIWLIGKENWRGVRNACSLVVSIVAGFTAAQYVFGTSLGIDELLIRDTTAAVTTGYPGRMAPAAALSFLLLGLALRFVESNAAMRFVRGAILLTTLISSLALVGFLYEARALSWAGLYSTIAIHTMLGFLIASASIFFARPTEGLMGVISSDSPGGALLRRLLPSLLGIVPSLGFLCVLGRRLELYDASLCDALLVMLSVVFLGATAAAVGASLHRVDLQRRQVAAELAEREQDLAITMQSIGDAVIATDARGNVVKMNRVAEQLTGWSLADATGQPLDEVFKIVNEETREHCESPVDRVLRDGKLVALANHTLLISKDGSERPIVDRAASIRGENGPIRGVVLVFRDATAERNAESALRASEARKAAILDSTFDAIVSMNEAGVVLEFNATAVKLFGYERHQAIGQPMADLIVPPSRRSAHHAGVAGYLKSGNARVLGKVVELPAMRADSSEFPAELAITRVPHHPEGLFTASLRDITERRKSEEIVKKSTAELQAGLKEREVLLQEVHHRVKNNLQVISSMINMQARKVNDLSTKNALRECQNRVQVISLIHEQLYQSKDYSKVPFSEYVTRLAGNILHATGMSPGAVKLNLLIETLSVTVDKAIPCGLILNELITNALKHAFPDERTGNIEVALRRVSEREILLSVKDDGVGLPSHFQLEHSDSLGIQLVSTLAEQLDGRLEVNREAGTMFSVTFPVEAHL